ncbi:MAG TPA: type IV secretion system protein VirB10 [Caulobacteraceae bacterium]|nr:type IV secretion system protein VirB10 [Caulobacteraceae bacterium]
MTFRANDPFAEDDAALLRRLSLPPSPVAGGERPWGFVAGLAGTAGLGLVVFLSLSAGRHARAQSTAPVSPIPTAIAPPPPAAPPPPPPVAQPAPPLPPPMAPSAADEQARLRAPSMVVDLSDAPDTGAVPPSAGGAVAVAAAGPAGAAGARVNPDERFAERVAGAQVDTARATRLTNTALVAPQGTVISAVLETGINSDLPGFVRAVVSRDVSGFDGSTVLIPRGSKLIGEYKSAVSQGQSRAFVIWTRLLTPDGVSINLGSPATDTLGRGGVAGETNTHFVHRFGAAILLSVIGAGLQALANEASNNSVNAVIISSPQQASNVATVALQKDIDIPPTITVPQGQAIRVFVSRDLDFSDVLQQAR